MRHLHGRLLVCDHHRYGERETADMSEDQQASPLHPDLTYRLAVSFTRETDRASYPYEVRRLRFQADDDDGRVALVVQVADPIPSLGDTALPFDMWDVILRWPVALYRDAVTPFWDELGFVDMFVLTIADERESVYELPPGVLGEYVAGTIGVDEMVDRMRISGSTP